MAFEVEQERGRTVAQALREMNAAYCAPDSYAIMISAVVKGDAADILSATKTLFSLSVLAGLLVVLVNAGFGNSFGFVDSISEDVDTKLRYFCKTPVEGRVFLSRGLYGDTSHSLVD
jgi:hypothetical protein